LSTAEALIFDLDGVIVHSTPLHNRAWEIYLERHGVSPERVQGRMHGLRNDEIVRDFFGTDLTADLIHAHGAAKEEVYRELMRPNLEVHIVDGVRGFLDRYRTVPKAVASNAEPANIEFVLGDAGLAPYFLHVVDGHDVVHPKPAPDIYLKAAGLLGVPADRCIVFEDSVPGVQAAVAAGMRVVGVTTTLRQLSGVQLHIDTFDDPHLEAWLAAQGVFATLAAGLQTP
jgi:beta-phosphoglucomutase